MKYSQIIVVYLVKSIHLKPCAMNCLFPCGRDHSVKLLSIDNLGFFCHHDINLVCFQHWPDLSVVRNVHHSSGQRSHDRSLARGKMAFRSKDGANHYQLIPFDLK